MKEDLKDYLYTAVQRFDASEDEKKELYEYIEMLSSSFEGVYSILKNEDSKGNIVKALEALGNKRKIDG